MNWTDWQLDWDEAFDNMQGHDRKGYYNRGKILPKNSKLNGPL